MIEDMKKIMMCILFCLVAMTTWADEQKKVTLSGDHTQETINLAYCNIFVKMIDEDGENAKVVVELENLSESKVLLLFDRSYSEKAVKRMAPSIRFDKTFGGTKGKRVIDACSQQLSRVMQFRPSDKYALPQFSVANGGKEVVKLPIYISKWKGTKKLILLEKQIIELEVEAELRPSAEYVSLTEEISQIESEKLCSHTAHSPKLAKQKENYQAKIDAAKQKIDDAIAAHGWHEGDSGYTRYMALKERLDAIDVDSHVIGNCGRHGRPLPECNNCNLSMQSIYQRMDDLYKRIYNSSNRQATKQSLMPQVNALYKCASQHTNHKSQWQRGGDYKNKIQERYNRINGL